MIDDIRINDCVLDLTDTAGNCFEQLHAMLELQPDGYVIVTFPLMEGGMGDLVVYRPESPFDN